MEDMDTPRKTGDGYINKGTESKKGVLEVVEGRKTQILHVLFESQQATGGSYKWEIQTLRSLLDIIST